MMSGECQMEDMNGTDEVPRVNESSEHSGITIFLVGIHAFILYGADRARPLCSTYERLPYIYTITSF